LKESRLSTAEQNKTERLAPRPRDSAGGAEVVTSTPEKFREFLKADVAKWAKVLKESGAKLD
jgi:hypothetical protein